MLDGSSLGGDPRGYRAVDLDGSSILTPLDEHSRKFRVTSYDCQEMNRHHNENNHEYLIPKSVLEADVVVNLPKLKTHRKVGITAALKNLVGINGHKDWLPHHRAGSVNEGGDEYRDPSIVKKVQGRLIEGIDKDPSSKMNSLRRFSVRVTNHIVKRYSSEPFFEGSWYGNETLWRTVLDLNRLLIYADKNGKVCNSPQRKCLTVVDGIIAGEGEGPMEPDPRKCGLLIGGGSPAAVDAVLSAIIGFDYKKIPLIRNAFNIAELPLTDFLPDEIEIRSNNEDWSALKVDEPSNIFRFKPAAGWIGHIEPEGRERKERPVLP